MDSMFSANLFSAYDINEEIDCLPLQIHFEDDVVWQTYRVFLSKNVYSCVYIDYGLLAFHQLDLYSTVVTDSLESSLISAQVLFAKTCL